MSGNLLPSQYSLTPAQLSALPSARWGTNPLTRGVANNPYSRYVQPVPQGLGLIPPKHVQLLVSSCACGRPICFSGNTPLCSPF